MSDISSVIRLQGLIDRVNIPLKYQNQFATIHQNLAHIYEQYQRHPDLVLKAINYSVLLGNLTPQHIELMRVSAALSQKVSRWQSTIEKINKRMIFEDAIPEEIYPFLEDLTDAVEEQDCSSSNLAENLTITSNPQSEKQNLTWYQLLMILLAILPIIVPYHINHMNSVQQNVQIQELVHHFLNEYANQTTISSILYFHR